MFDIIFVDIPVLIYCMKPRPSSLLRSRFKMERLDRLSIDGLIHAINLGIDIYHPGSGGDAIIQTTTDGVNYLWGLFLRGLAALVLIVSAAAAVLSLIK